MQTVSKVEVSLENIRDSLIYSLLAQGVHGKEWLEAATKTLNEAIEKQNNLIPFGTKVKMKNTGKDGIVVTFLQQLEKEIIGVSVYDTSKNGYNGYEGGLEWCTRNDFTIGEEYD